MNKEDRRLEKSPAFSQFLQSWEAGEDLVAAGATGSAPAYLVAQAFLRHPCPLVVLVPDIHKAERCQGELSGLLARRVALYPALEAQSSGADAGDPALVGERLAIASSFLGPGAEVPVIVTTPAAWSQPLPDPDGFQDRKIVINIGDKINLTDLLTRLVDAGYENRDPIDEPGQFARRGGVVDVFSVQEDFPTRIEFFGETVDSLRRFDTLEQRSTGKIDHLIIYPAAVADGEANLGNYLSSDCRLVAVDPEDSPSAAEREKSGLPLISLFTMPPPGGADVNLSISSLEKFKYPGPGVLHPLLEAIPRWLKEDFLVILYAYNPGEKDRLKEILEEKGVYPHPALDLRQGELAAGFIWPEAGLAAVSDSEIFSRYEIQHPHPKYRRRGEPPEQVRFEEGDYVVHVDHGIGLYLGVKTIFSGGKSKQMLAVRYAESGKLYIPLTQARLLTRYLGLGKKTPELDRLGGKRWAAARSKAARAVNKMAAQILEAQAWRQTLNGHRFSPDTPWQKEFEAAFIYPETPDQSQALEEIKADMESERPMDRLLCGDVGYGKTEVAIRAAFKAVMDGRQVAVMVPTTVLAQQHYYTFSERMADYPIRVEMLSRFIPPARQRKIIENLSRGRVDIVIGTSRLVQRDVRFKSLGLVIIDEEQRFGVGLKERIKQMRLLVDVLTLTATPIPRTLHLSLSGARDLSTINTPPHDRLAVETRVLPYEPERARQAIAFELQRGGQVYYLHNRVRSIVGIRDSIQKWFQDKRVAIGHGQMDENELADVMRLFSRGEIDVLVSTTIIESGLDIPNANTIIVENADRFGLADLYQLRGRVGRFKRRAYAYLFYSSWKYLPETAHQRLRAIEEFSHLGAGFSLALRDLEIRGAGNILGQEQHGHIAAVGFDLYCRLLRRSMERLKGRAAPPEVETRLDFDLGAEIPQDYISDDFQRIEMSRKWAGIENADDRKEWLAELRDRFGPPPPAVASLAAAADLRIAAKTKGITSISEENGKFIFRRFDNVAVVLAPPLATPAKRLRLLATEVTRLKAPPT